MDFVLTLLKLPFVGLLKVLIFLLNIIPTSICEVHGVGAGTLKIAGSAHREMHSMIQGKNRLHLGSVLIAHTRGAIFDAKRTDGTTYRGVWTDVYQDIQAKWAL